MFLGELLVAQKLVASSSHIAQALEVQKQKGGRIGSILMSLGLATHDSIATGLSKQLGVPAALAKHFKSIDSSAIKTINATMAQKHNAIPFAYASVQNIRRLVVCCRDPMDDQMQRDIKKATSMEVVSVVAPERTIFSMLETCFNVKASPPAKKTESTDHESEGHGFQLAMLDDEFVNKSAQKYSDPKERTISKVGIQPTSHLKSTSSMPAAVLAPSLSLDDAKKKIEKAASRDDIVEPLFAYLRSFADAAVLLQIKDDIALGYKGYGGKFDRSSVQSIVLPLSAESIVSKAISEKRDVFQSKKKDHTTVEERFLKFFSDQYIFRGCVPVTIKNRIVMAIYLHGSDLGAHKDELTELKTVFSKSILRLIKASKK